MNLMGKKDPYYGKSMSSNFPGSPHTMGFIGYYREPMVLAVFSHVMVNWWENTCISHVMKYTIKVESNGKKAPILWEKYEYHFPRFSPHDGFGFIFLYHGNWWGNLCISHMMKYTIGWESDGKKTPILWEKYEYQFPRLWEIDEKIHAFPIW